MIDNTYNSKEMTAQQVSGMSAFEVVTIKVASPEVIRSWSHGEIKNPETINYRSFKPEKGGLFCERIFGPQKDWECSCGKYKRVKNKGIICDRCGVEVTQSKVRRERMGHIELAVPVSHIWFFKCMPSRIGLMLDMTARTLERIIYYEDWVVVDPGDTPLKLGESLTDINYRQARDEYGDAFQAEMGAPAIRTLLQNIELEPLHSELETLLTGTKNKAIRKKLSKRLRLVEGFLKSNSRPEWMIMEVLPVIPPDLRPLVPLEGGRFATSDLNDLYRRVINRNSRLKNLLQLRTPEVIIRNEKRMLQEAVDALLDNGRHGRPVTGAGNRPLKSLSDMLKGKQGRFRQNLLGKRVDYSGRSVIVVGPELKLMQCGLPKKMALILFEPFIIRHLKGRGFAHTVRGAKKMIERGEPVVWDILEEVTKGHPVMLNRAPTLHRLSIQAFDPILIEGSAIRLHPLVCTAYNADFDGDQMAVHVPLSPAAQLECKLLMLSTNNIFSPSNGKPITTPTQDITLGVYYLTADPRNKERIRIFKDVHEVLFALDSGYIKIHDAIKLPNPDYGVATPRGNATDKFIITTPGRCIFNRIWEKKLGFYNAAAKKKDLGRLIAEAYEHIGHDKTIELLDKLKNLGYEYATLAGFSISVADMLIPKRKPALIAETRARIEEIKRKYDDGFLTVGERHNQVVDAWTKTANTVADELTKEVEEASRKEINPVFAMLDSGARGSKDQIKQLAGMRGLMTKPSGEIIERPILSSFREGLTVLEYFISTHGARKGLADTALKTADSGYMTRKLVDVAQDIICRKEDCGTLKGIYVEAIIEGDEIMLPLKARLIGRYSAQDIRDPAKSDGSFIIRAGEEFTPERTDLIEKRGISKVLIRSVLTCDVEHGVCIKCYGKNLATDHDAEIGDALGIIAAQSIGEPGTQLTMRTFHIGGISSGGSKEPVITARQSGTVRFENLRLVTDQKGNTLVVNKNGFIVVYDDAKAREAEAQARERVRLEAQVMGSSYAHDYDFWSDAVKDAEIDRYQAKVGAVLYKKDGDKVKPREKIASWDAYQMPIIAEETGIVALHDIVEGVTLNRSERGGIEELTVMEHREDLLPQVVVNDKNGELVANYPLPTGALLMVKRGEKVYPGMTLARVPRSQQKNRDITGGLPRVAELFEARMPKEVAEIARIDGIVDKGKNVKGRQILIVRDPDNKDVFEEHNIPTSKHLIVGKGDYVRKGQKLTVGSIIPQKLLEICGPHELQRYIVNEIQKVYRAQGVEINDKHIEIIIRQMMQKVRILDQGDTAFLAGEQVDRYEFIHANDHARKLGKRPAEGEPVLLGIAKASLETESFISSASFQDTTRILTDAATLGKVDVLRGFKENVITGHLIPAGTGAEKFQNLHMTKLGEEIPIERPPLELNVSRKEESVENIDFGDDEVDDIFSETNESSEEEDFLGKPDEDEFLDEFENGKNGEFDDDIDDSEFDPTKDYENE
ncbi:MAG: DNA-directed RNA polymerase subunit beta' [Lentisphaerae bacterium ADurb.Bin242]|nr:MAG: DNA-directed RNA polymerase subunit beta' [Lentisphaerae bacterium ADurb.Bin242]